MTQRTVKLVLVVAAGCVAATLAVILIPPLQFAYRSPDLHVVVQTATSLVVFLAALLTLGRFLRQRRLDDLFLCLAFGMLGLSNVFFAAIPAAAGDDTSPFATWSVTTGRLLATVGFAAAALAPPRRIELSRRREIAIGVGLVAMVGGIAAVFGALHSSLPMGVDVIPEESNRPRLEGHWAILAAQGAGFALYALAAAGFARRATRERDGFLAWLAVAAVFGAASRVNYLLYPSAFTEWVYTGDAFRLMFDLVVLGAAVAEVGFYWRSVAEVAAFEERRRIARELHDGLAQELARIRTNLSWLDQDDRFVQRARAGADRALLESRMAIATLGDRWDGTADDVLADVARHVGEREGARVALTIDRGVDLSPAQREALVMIASEAITNAARHGGAEVVRVELSGEPLRLTVRDEGRGFDPAAGNGAGFGLTSMRQRAEAIGARLVVSSAPQSGTQVEVRL